MEEGMSGFCIQVRTKGGGYGVGNGADSGTKCGRWNPTAEQVKVLSELFRSGLRTPSTDQIQKISTQLSFYGKIESKNVFYWFQNHKARERQKQRRVSKDTTTTTNNNSNDVSCFQLDDHPLRRVGSTKYFSEINQVTTCEPERAMETLQLFPLNSYNEPESESESESEKRRMFSNECKEKKYSTFAYAFGREFDHPPLDLRLSFF